jgi:hypothetical protein
MRLSFSMKSVAAAVAASAILWTAAAPAEDDHFTLKLESGSVTVTANTGWHVNKDYPWKVKQGDKTVAGKEAFTFAEMTAKVSGLPKGTVTLKGGVCSPSSCQNFSKDIVVP